MEHVLEPWTLFSCAVPSLWGAFSAVHSLAPLPSAPAGAQASGGWAMGAAFTLQLSLQHVLE